MFFRMGLVRYWLLFRNTPADEYVHSYTGTCIVTSFLWKVHKSNVCREFAKTHLVNLVSIIKDIIRI